MTLEESSWSVYNGKRPSTRENECAQSIAYIFLMYKSNVWPDGFTGRKVKGRQKNTILNGHGLSVANLMESSAKLSFPRLKC